MTASESIAAPPLDARQKWVFAWGIFGVVAALIEAIVRLLPLALEPILEGSLGPISGAAYVSWVVVNGYAEGYRGFQVRFVPVCVARAAALARRRPSLGLTLAAPFVCFGLAHATRRRLIASWALVAAITVAIFLVRLLPQPHRGIIDGGVVVGLTYGTVVLLVETMRVFRGVVPDVDPQMPEDATLTPQPAKARNPSEAPPGLHGA